MKRKNRKTRKESETTVDPGEWQVERIISKRINPNGGTEYFLKWVGWDEGSNSWEPVENIYCVDLIAAFEEKLKQGLVKEEPYVAEEGPFTPELMKPSTSTVKTLATLPRVSKRSSEKPLATSSGNANGTDFKEEEIMEEIDKTLVPEKVVGAWRTSDGQLMIIMKWRNREKRSAIPAEKANPTWPHLIIRYYEQRIRWTDVR